jgi:hypothetical protein
MRLHEYYRHLFETPYEYETRGVDHRKYLSLDFTAHRTSIPNRAAAKLSESTLGQASLPLKLKE